MLGALIFLLGLSVGVVLTLAVLWHFGEPVQNPRNEEANGDWPAVPHPINNEGRN